MSNVDITITIQTEDRLDGYVVLPPGGRLSGVVLIQAQQEVKCRKGTLTLGWHTEGRGTRYEQTVATRELFQGSVAAARPLSFPFEFDLPHEPWSYSGHYISIVWHLTLTLDMPLAKDISQRVQFVLRPLAKSGAGSVW